MLRRLLTVLMLLLLAPLSAGTTSAEQPARFALLIGNQSYTDAVGPLKNPHNDVALVGRALGEVGFTIAKPVEDGTRDDMLFAVHEHAGKLRAAGKGAVGFLYYTGHGVAAAGENVLVPVNAAATSEAELSVRGVKLNEVIRILTQDAPQAVHFVVLDACRVNMRGSRGAKGFVPVDDSRTGVVIAFATAAGETASDEGPASGPYAAALAEEIVKPGANDQSVFNAVRKRVREVTGGQTPWTHDGLIGDRVVFKSLPHVANPPVQPPTPSASPEPNGTNVKPYTQTVAPPQMCDHLAANPDDSEKVSPGMGWNELNGAAAIRECEKALRAYPSERRFKYQLARGYQKSEKPDLAFPLLQELVELRYIAAYDNMAWYYEQRGGRQDMEKAIEWYVVGASAGSAEAMNNLGLLYLKLADTENAKHWFRNAAQKSYRPAELNLRKLERRDGAAPTASASGSEVPPAIQELGEEFLRAVLAKAVSKLNKE